MRWLLITICGIGWLVLVFGVAGPLGGMVKAWLDPRAIEIGLVAVPPPLALLARSLTVSGVATAGAVLLGLWPAALLANARGRARPLLWGLVLAPLLMPPQVYAYAWGLVGAPGAPFHSFLAGTPAGVMRWLGESFRAGLISACWLWPVVAMILAAGWQTSGRVAHMLAALDTTPARAFVRAVLPALRLHLACAASLVFAITLLDYGIPHLSLARIYATEMMVLVDVGAPPGQVMRMAGQVLALVLLLVAAAALSIRGTENWGSQENGDARHPPAGRPGWFLWATGSAVWLLTLGVPAATMWASLRMSGVWGQGFALFSREWQASLGVSLGAAALAAAVGTGTILLSTAGGVRQRWLRGGARVGALAAFLSAIVPAAALGVGFILVFNRDGWLGELYTRTPVVWCLALAARFAGIVVLVCWLAVGRQSLAAAEQARADGADAWGVLGAVLLPMLWPSLLAAGLMVMFLSMFEVVATQLVGPLGFPSIALTLLSHMHYGRDDVVITTTLIVVAAGILVTQACAWLLVGRLEN